MLKRRVVSVEESLREHFSLFNSFCCPNKRNYRAGVPNTVNLSDFLNSFLNRLLN
jgi:hypothetical protein